MVKKEECFEKKGEKEGKEETKGNQRKASLIFHGIKILIASINVC